MKPQQGFTLIEVMIVVAIIGVLAAIAYPSYQDSITKSHRAQAKSTLFEYAQFMERNFSTTGDYAKKADGSAIALPSLQGAVDLASHYDFALGTGTTATTATAFVVSATPKGAQATRDTKCGTLTLDQSGIKTESGTGTVKDCW